MSVGLLLGCVAVSTTLATSTLVLRNGATLTGDVLRRKADRVVIDLGFTVLTVPADEIVRIVDDGSRGREAARRAPAAGLWREAPEQEELTVKENLGRCAEAVVEVRTPTSLGSGFLIDPAGYVVTNDHVIAGEHRVTVTVFRESDGALQRASFQDVAIVATDPHHDLALLKILDPDSVLPTVPLGDSDTLRQGQAVFAIGSPLGFDRTVSEGIVSLRNRPIRGLLYIQSTAQLNPGNSGGPLFNLRGEVVGINNLKIAAAGIEGLSFSVVVNDLKTFLRNRDAFAFDPRNPNAGFRYNPPPRATSLAPPSVQGERP